MRIIVFLVALMLYASDVHCQRNFFNGFGSEYHDAKGSQNKDVDKTYLDNRSDGHDKEFEMTLDSLKGTIQSSTANEKAPRKTPRRLSSYPKREQRLKLYDGESHPLTMRNLLAVMEEVGVTNQIIVLAQSLLETDFFASNVCKRYNNLFGLYDSRSKRYYSFERWEDSVVGYRKFIQYRYKSGNYFAFLKRIGYAEDPQYISKVGKITKKLCKCGNIID